MAALAALSSDEDEPSTPRLPIWPSSKKIMTMSSRSPKKGALGKHPCRQNLCSNCAVAVLIQGPATCIRGAPPQGSESSHLEDGGGEEPPQGPRSARFCQAGVAPRQSDPACSATSAGELPKGSSLEKKYRFDFWVHYSRFALMML